MPQDSTISARGAMWRVAAAVIVAIALRACLLDAMPVISRDGVTFIRYAQDLRIAPLDEMRRQRQAPLYPALIAAAHGLLDRAGIAPADDVRRWIIAGQTVALAASLALVPAIYLLACVIFDRRVGVVAAACAAVVPEFCRYGVDVLSDSLHLALYIFALTAGLSGLRRRSPSPLAPLPRSATGLPSFPAPEGPARVARGTSPGSRVQAETKPRRGDRGVAPPHAGAETVLPKTALAGLLSGLAFLVRPEGGEVAFIMCGALCIWRPWPLRVRLAGIAACALGFLLIAGPYMLATGHVIHKKAPARFLGAEPASAAQPAGCVPPCRPRVAQTTAADRNKMLAVLDAGAVFDAVWTVPRALGKTLLNWIRSLRVMFLLPAVAWLALRERRPEPNGVGRVAVAAWFLHVAVCVLLIRAFDYWNLFSVRHVLVLAALTLPWTAAGLVALAGFLAEALPSPRAAVRIWLVLSVVLVGPTLPWLLRTPNTDDAYLREAGEWIARTYARPQRILTDQWHVPFYARGTLCERHEGTATVRWPGTADAAALLDWVRSERPDLIVLDEYRLRRKDAAFFDELDRIALKPGLLRLAHRAENMGDPKRPRRAIVYEVRP